MDHNKHNLQIGETVMLDNDKANRSEVVIVRMTPNKMFSTVRPAALKEVFPSDCWDVMTNRLSPIDDVKLRSYDAKNLKRD